MQKIISFLKQNLDSFMVIIIVISGFALYANTFGNKMFWDDNDFVLNNAFVHSWQYLPQYFSQNVIAGAGFISNYWRPVLLFVFSIEYHLWGAHVFGYHLVNLLFHIANALLLFYLLKSLFSRTWLAFLTSLIFLIHPLQTEAVTYVNSLGDSLSVFFMLLGLNNYLYFRTQPSTLNPLPSSFWWSVAFFPLALMSKETAIVYPGLIVLVELFANQKKIASASVKSLVRLAKTTWPSIAIAGIYILLRATALNFQNTFNLYNQQNTFTTHIWIRVLTFFKSLWIYLGLLIYPHNLHMERSLEIAQSFWSPQVLGGFAFFAVLIILAIWQYKQHPEISFGCLWFLICLAPTSNILVPINGLLYEHWLYLPMVGFFLMVFGLFSVIPDLPVRQSLGVGGIRNPDKKRYFWILVFAGMTIYFLFLSGTTIARNRQWRDPITFYNQTLQYAPDSYRVINNLGMAYNDADQNSLAIVMYQRAIALDQANAVAYHNLGNTYKALGQTNLAIQNFEIAIGKDPHFFYSYNALAQLYLDQKKYDQAIEVLQHLAVVEPDNTTVQTEIDQIKQLK